MEYRIAFRFSSSFRVGSGHGWAGLFDHTPLFDSKGWIYLPGSSIKGNLRHTCFRMIVSLARENVTTPVNFRDFCPAERSVRFCGEGPCAFCRLFGSPRYRGRYVFNDAILAENMDFVRNMPSSEHFCVRAIQTEARTRVALSRTRRVAAQGRLFFSQNAAANLEFTQMITGPDDEEVETLLDYSCSAMTHLGADSAVGLGRLRLEVIDQ